MAEEPEVEVEVAEEEEVEEEIEMSVLDALKEVRIPCCPHPCYCCVVSY